MSDLPKVGDVVSWRGQSETIYDSVVKVTEPEPGNYVLWFEDGFCINSKSVKVVSRV